MRSRKGAILVGLLEGLLLTRLVALLFAARPDNPVIALLLIVTTPLVAPFHRFDRMAGQPQFGARLELATLTAIVVVLVIAAILLWLHQRYSNRQPREKYNAQSKGPYR